MSDFDPQLYALTPSVTVLDSRGLAIRQLEFYRHQAGSTPERRIAHIKRNSCGESIALTDPRQAARGGLPSETSASDLSGNKIITHSADAGTSVQLLDIAGRPLLTIDPAGNRRTFDYDPENGRLIQRNEIATDGSKIATDYYIYGEYSSQEKKNNLGGQQVLRYDPAGCESLESVSVGGQPLRSRRQFLVTPESRPNWNGDGASREKYLSATFFISENYYNSLGETICIVDARGNKWRYLRDINGRLKQSWLTLENDSEQPVITGVEYAANGQKMMESQANGCKVTMLYEPDTLRLSKMCVSDPQTTLQTLVYTYDPKGNIITITDTTQEPRYWNNQRTEAQRNFSYDSLYQLTEATGRELASNTRGDSVQSRILSRNTPEYVNYTRWYQYDMAGNLMQLRHSGADSYTHILCVAEHSNRAVYSPGAASLNPDDYFDVYGNQLSTNNGVILNWNTFGELQRAILLNREQSASDEEYYLYNGANARVQKLRSVNTGQQVNQDNVCYLPGLEIHQRFQGGNLKEEWTVICDPLVSGIRALSWSMGLPAGIKNNQVRYSYQDIVSSVMLELDQDGNVISQEEYFPFGGTSGYLVENDIVASYKTRRYSGKEQDVSGLYYYGYRYYNPIIGRWMSPDPLGLAAGLNRYAFVKNNPINSRDIAGLIRDEDLSPELLGAIGAIPGGQDGQYGSELFSRLYWGDKALDDERINPFAKEIDQAAAGTHARLTSESRNQGLLDNLSSDDVEAINLYSQQSIPFHSIQRYANSNFEFEWDKDADGQTRQAYPLHYAGLLENALEKIPAYNGKSYRGALLAGAAYKFSDGYTPSYKGGRPLQQIQKGDYVSTVTYFSTSAERKVASEFALRQRFGNSFEFDTAVFEIKGISGRNITELTHIEQAEVLISPGAVFEVADISRGQYGVNIKLNEVNSDRAWQSGRTIRDYRFGYEIAHRPLIPRT